MIQRTLQHAIEASLVQYPVVGILGSRQVGKTTLARMIGQSFRKKPMYLDLELPSDYDKLQEPELYLSQFTESLVIIDEIQRMPSLFPLIRALVDKNRTPGRFLILGSASPDLIRQASESLAGRIIYHELTPLTLQETDWNMVNQLWLRGGYPESYLASSDAMSLSWRESFARTYLEMDIPMLGIQVPAVHLRRFWTMLAHAHGQLWNASQIAGSLGITAPTVRRYLDILDDTFIVRQLQPYHANLGKRITKSPKIYIRDSGMLHALLKLSTLDLLQAYPSAGFSWEGFVIEQIIRMIPHSWQYYFFRTIAGAEVDLLFLNDKNQFIAVEVKYSLSPKVLKGFWNAFHDLSCTQGFVVYPGDEFYPIAEKVYALPVSQLLHIIA
ncbi:MAG: ATPase [Syntrophus sp. (in: bacteria)]|nr:ATPase [Syntrophus sp. (in: bacteria)]